MPSSVFKHASPQRFLFNHAVAGPMLPGKFASGLDCAPVRAMEHEPRPFPLGIALSLIILLSLALWAGVVLLLRAFVFG